MQAFQIHLTQRALAFLFEFKRTALPEISEAVLQKQTPTINVWTESVFDEVRIMTIKPTINYRQQIGAPIPVWESSSGYNWILLGVPSIKEFRTHFKEFHFCTKGSTCSSFCLDRSYDIIIFPFRQKHFRYCS